MSLDFTLTCEHCGTAVYSGNITHNLTAMADEAGIYKTLWRPEEIPAKTAADLIDALTAGLAEMKAAPARFERHNAPNGWGLYEHFVPFVEEVLAACRRWPNATIRTSR